MQPLERVRRTRSALAAAIAVRAILWALVAALGVAAVGIVLARRAGLSTTTVAWSIAGLVAAGVLLWLLSPWRRLTVPRVALWIEERVPRLQYALVTAVDPVGTEAHIAAALSEQVSKVSWSAETRAAIARTLARPAVAFVAAALALMLARRVDLAAARAPDTMVSGTSTAGRS